MSFLKRTLLLLSSILVSTHAASNSCANAKSDAVRNIRFRVSYSPNTMESVVISGWSSGGTARGKIADTTTSGDMNNAINNTFAGREFGGGERQKIYGTREYGSGYPYGADGAGPSSSIAGRPFPYGVWPISWGPNYLGGGEFYGDDLDMIRPGGPLGVVRVSTKDTGKWPGVSADEVYEMIGDKESLAFMIADLVDWCHATPQWPRKFDPTRNITTNGAKMPKPENVIQYYRASSFALAYEGYNSSSSTSTPSASGYSFDHTSPLPSTIAPSAFLRCVNDTISVALPIMPSYKDDGGLNGGEVAGIIIGTIVFIIVVWYIVSAVWGWYDQRRTISRKSRVPSEDPDVALDVRGEGNKHGADRSEENTLYQ